MTNDTQAEIDVDEMESEEREEYLDDEQIVASMETAGDSSFVNVYYDNSSKKWVRNLSIGGVREATNLRGGYDIELIKEVETDDAFRVTIYAIDQRNNTRRIGAASNNKKSDYGKADTHADTKAYNKATRNGLAQYVATAVARAIIDRYHWDAYLEEAARMKLKGKAVPPYPFVAPAGATTPPETNTTAPPASAPAAEETEKGNGGTSEWKHLQAKLNTNVAKRKDEIYKHYGDDNLKAFWTLIRAKYSVSVISKLTKEQLVDALNGLAQNKMMTALDEWVKIPYKEAK